jgi:hypothetical protein
MPSLIATSPVGLKPRTAIPVNMNALPHIATRANSSSQWPSGRVIAARLGFVRERRSPGD